MCKFEHLVIVVKARSPLPIRNPTASGRSRIWHNYKTKFDPLRFAPSVTNPVNRNTAGRAIEVPEID
ncbi:MAG: hypothetical protein MUE44_20615 [Oscillatoriaceae cyanobacterium Prado104]|nr:hypothetical protein [Oscillatoriaceae cyanobacterium Prado104]